MFARYLPGIAACAAWMHLAAAQQATQSVQAAQQAELSQEIQGGLVSSSMSSSESYAPASESDSDIGEQVLLQPAQKYQAFQILAAQKHLWAYYERVALQRGMQGGRNSGKAMTYGEAYQRLFPMAVEELA